MDIAIYIGGGVGICMLLALIICTKIFGGEKILAFFKSTVFQTVVAIICAIVMYFTPDNVDKYIIMIMTVLGITPLLIAPFVGKNYE